MQTAHENLEHLTIGELEHRADGGDPAAAAVLEAFEQECATAAAGAAKALDAQFAHMAQVARRAIEKLTWPAGAVMMAPTAPGATAVSKTRGNLVRSLKEQDARLARVLAKLLGRPRHRRFVSHLPLRRSR